MLSLWLSYKKGPPAAFRMNTTSQYLKAVLFSLMLRCLSGVTSTRDHVVIRVPPETTIVRLDNDNTLSSSPALLDNDDDDAWKTVIRAYQLIKQDSTVPEDRRTLERLALKGRGGFHIPFQVRVSEERGRGVFSTAFVPNGTEIWDGVFAYFRNESEWRQFLSMLPIALARDVCAWAYVTEDEEDKSHKVGLDLGEGSLLNHAMTFTGDDYAEDLVFANIEEQSDRYYASRDIYPGEELLCDYLEFDIQEHALPWFETTRLEHGISEDEDFYLES